MFLSSKTMRFRFARAPRTFMVRAMLKSSTLGKPVLYSGQSCEFRVADPPAAFRLASRRIPLFSSHSPTFRLLISVYLLPPFCFMKSSTQSNTPSAGSPTGKITSCVPFGRTILLGSTSAFAAWEKIWHLNGKGFIGASVCPRLTSSVRFLKVRTGKSVLPWSPSGSGFGCAIRKPFLKRDIVFLFALPSSKFRRKPMMSSFPNRCEQRVSRIRLNMKDPSLSKQQLSRTLR